MLFQIVLLLLLLIITAVISIASYLTDKGEHTAFYKINNNVYIKTSKIINYYIVLILYSSHTHHIRKHTHTHTHARTHTHTHSVSLCVSLSHTHTHTHKHAHAHTQSQGHHKKRVIKPRTYKRAWLFFRLGFRHACTAYQQKAGRHDCIVLTSCYNTILSTSATSLGRQVAIEQMSSFSPSLDPKSSSVPPDRTTKHSLPPPQKLDLFSFLFCPGVNWFLFRQSE